MAGAVLALALIGALSAGMASGVDRVRRKKLPRASDLSTPTEEVPHRSAQAPRASAHATGATAHPDLSRDTPSRTGQHPKAAPVKTNAPVSSPPITVLAQAPGEEATEADDLQPPPTLPATTARVPAPLHVSWRVVESSAGTVKLIARLERSPGFTAPVEVSLRVPSRTLLQDGPSSPIVLGVDVQEVPWTLALPEGTSPEEDLVLLASAEGEAFGVHAEARYRFGRTPVEGPRPTPTGPPLPEGFMRARE
ncbi:hypothetical protein D7Y13_12015 [Corallococcus praedator]|uniref:Secreted protein n=1 Tax=Corallococcus praedator TaxID=2316724 RepID=A0ABX9QLD5_9BACT|nr:MULTISPECIES: hypothetical protein [Corallococcus]RKH31806.1 hypothetical protein D7X75_18065 [Corallococcus sp. CA031C]RKI10829.1 hypothetical protein D7Y13_12015 [Corallococcus praedator]